MNHLLNEKLYSYSNFDSMVKNINGKDRFTEDELNNIFSETLSYMDDAIYFAELNEGRIIQKAKEIKYKTNKNVDKVDDKVGEKIKSIQNSIKEDIREKEIKGMPVKVSRLIKIACTVGVAWAINPAIAMVAAVTSAVITNQMSLRERDKLLTELKEEYEIVEEKIKDADNSGDKNKKYELMRLRNQIGKNIQRLNYKEASKLKKKGR